MNSPIVSYTCISPNQSGKRKYPISRISIHCVVGQCSVQALGAVFAKQSNAASSNYGIGADGKIGLYVPEDSRSWCTSSADNDNRAVTIEVASDTVQPYAVRDAAYQSLLTLVTDICKRNGKTKLIWISDKTKALAYQPAENEMLLTVHRWFSNKACPGDYLLSRHASIAETVTKRLQAQEKCTITLPLLQKGDENGYVVTLQILLNKLTGAGLDEDGCFGALTDLALREYQKSCNLDADGCVGPMTWMQLLD